jgi:hypothetical protein
MTIRETIVALCIALALPVTAHAGGPVIVEETPQVDADTEDGRIPGWVVVGGLLIIGAALIGGGSDCTCFDQPDDGGGSCGC